MTMPTARILTSRAYWKPSVDRRFLTSLAKAAVSSPTIIQPSPTELRREALDMRNLETAVRQLHQDGIVVVEDVVPHRQLEHLNAKMILDARILQARAENSPYNYNQGNLQIDPPPVAEYFHQAVFVNPIVTQITSVLLGPRPKLTFVSANAAMPLSTQRQPVHSDADFSHPSHAFALVVNVPLVDMRPVNGSTEVWLGSHNSLPDAQEGVHGERASGRIKEEYLEERKSAGCGPVQPVIKKGSVVIRDLRLWHAGMPNSTEEVRIMLAMIHFAPWYRNRMRLQLGEDVRPMLESLERKGKLLGLEIPIDWVGREEVLGSYLARGFGNSYDFDQEA
ncbi:uncharacterized protein BCR38DRAFT_115520 [Pseudomassariella vexata]|uniref:Phytanoyl-CoA dioxygenase n=1 Tax=Pseudomassariella vexata TaxID=1141098 RepID=A0A1Y2DBS6_9PEZI|nr:uncharacterized protein BCR38DRAFT_115520 [Pseudomassariella vexata]ORY56647.1 hypothetical protein BCR38DRAFT_115520 [Pseudomassariella vexata]